MTLTDHLVRLHTNAQALGRLVDAVCECADSTIAAMRADLNDAHMRVSRLADERNTLRWLLAEARWWADDWQSIGRACVIDKPEPFPWEDADG